MRWDFIIPAWLDRLAADAELVSLIGVSNGEPNIYPAQNSKPVRVPSIEYLAQYDRESELWNLMGIQVDFWAKGIRIVSQIEKRLRALTHWDVGQMLDGERLWLQYRDGRTLEYPADVEVTHRQLDFEFEAGRIKYINS